MSQVVVQKITEKITKALKPTQISVEDESHLHAGHAGARPGGETHFRLTVVSVQFTGLSLVKRHRLINEALAEELQGPIHALAIKALSPDEV
jgi:BolA family transcriptional regulator, general stress-responsive regulator